MLRYAYFVAAFGLLGYGAANAQLPQAPHAGPISLTMVDKVNGAEYVVIAKALRIYFVDERYRELTKPPTEPGFNAAALDLHIERVLYPSNAELKTATVDIASSYRNYGAPLSMFDRQKQSYLGQSLIYFLNSQQVVEAASSVRYFFPRFFPLKGPIDNPLPLSDLRSVEESIKKRLERERAAK
jgi:hypothetical protein